MKPKAKKLPGVVCPGCGMAGPYIPDRHYASCKAYRDLMGTGSPPPAPPDPVNHPPHYKGKATCDGCGCPIECIDVTRHANFNRGNAIKYVWRAGAKGDAIEDLKKAIWYLQDEIKRLEAEGGK